MSAPLRGRHRRPVPTGLARHNRDTRRHHAPLRTQTRVALLLTLTATTISTDWADPIIEWVFILGMCGLLIGADLVGIQ